MRPEQSCTKYSSSTRFFGTPDPIFPYLEAPNGAGRLHLMLISSRSSRLLMMSAGSSGTVVMVPLSTMTFIVSEQFSQSQKHSALAKERSPLVFANGISMLKIRPWFKYRNLASQAGFRHLVSTSDLLEMAASCDVVRYGLEDCV